MRTILRILCLASFCGLLPIAGVGCGDDDDGSPASGGSGGAGGDTASGGSVNDTAAPTIERVTPADGATGILADTNIVIRFNEPMDLADTQAAYQSSDIPSGDVVFRWSADGRELTVDPVEPLEYAMGVFPSDAPAKEYSFSISTAAADRAGNALAQTEMFTFSAARALTVRLEVDPLLSGNVTPTATPDVGPIAAGDDAQNLSFRGFATFSLAGLPAETIDIHRADFVLASIDTTGEPWQMGPLKLVHVTFAAVDAEAYDAAPLRDLGTLLPADNTSWMLPIALDATAAVLDDFNARAERMNRSQYRLQFQLPTDALDDIDFLTMSAGYLDVAVLVP
jgi:hypothetical protein